MRLVSWNVNGRYGRALRAQIETVLNHGPSLICLQEVRAESVDQWCSALTASGFEVETTRDLVGQRRYFLLSAHRARLLERLPAKTFEVPFAELMLSLVLDLDGLKVEVLNTHVPNGSGNGWRKIEHLDALYAYIARSHGRHEARLLCGDFNCPRAERNNRVFTWAERDDLRLIPDRGLRWDAGERRVIAGLAAFDLIDVYRDTVPQAAQDDVGSHRSGGRERRYDHVFASGRLRPWTFEYVHEVRHGETASSDHSMAVVELTPAASTRS